MKKNLPDEFIECGWNIKNVTIKGKNIANTPDKELYSLAKTMLRRVCNNKDTVNDARTAKVNLFHIEADLDDGSHISVPFIVKKHKDKWYYVTPEFFMKEDKNENE